MGNETKDGVVDPLRVEHQRLRAEARRSRAAFSRSPEGVLSASILGALDVRAKMKADGASEEACDRYLEDVVRASWPRGRSEPWHYTCDTCSDTGWQRFRCRPGMRCAGDSTAHGRRRLCTTPGTDYEHDEVRPCMCAKGQAMRAKPGQTDSSEAGARKPRRGFTKFGG